MASCLRGALPKTDMVSTEKVQRKENGNAPPVDLRAVCCGDNDEERASRR